MIIEDSEKTKALAVDDERRAADAYAKVLADSAESMNDLRKSLTSSQEARAETSEAHQQTKEDLKDAMSTLESLQKRKAGLHQDCDFLLQNFEQTQSAMMQEVD